MGDRKHFSATEAAYDAADAVRKEDESWSEYLERSAKALEGDGENGPETDLAGKLDDVLAELPKRTADEVENRLTGR